MGTRSDNHKIITAYFELFAFNKRRNDNHSASLQRFYNFSWILQLCEIYTIKKALHPR